MPKAIARPWTKAELAYLRKHYPAGDRDAIAIALKFAAAYRGRFSFRATARVLRADCIGCQIMHGQLKLRVQFPERASVPRRSERQIRSCAEG